MKLSRCYEYAETTKLKNVQYDCWHLWSFTVSNTIISLPLWWNEMWYMYLGHNCIFQTQVSAPQLLHHFSNRKGKMQHSMQHYLEGGGEWKAVNIHSTALYILSHLWAAAWALQHFSSRWSALKIPRYLTVRYGSSHRHELILFTAYPGWKTAGNKIKWNGHICGNLY